VLRPACPPRGTAILGALIIGLTACTPPPERATVRDGQWIWSVADQRIFLAARLTEADLLPGVWVSTISFDPAAGQLAQYLALSPSLVAGAPLAPVIRLDKSVHLAWDALDDATIQRRLVTQVTEILGHLARSGAIVAEVQLDYDCPTRRLARWAGVVRALKAGPLRNHEVWITSLVAHVRRPEFGPLFRGVVAGHILQVFDTGDEASPSLVGELVYLLQRQRMPFRLGLGAFERVLSTKSTTDHRHWFRTVAMFSRLPEYRGLWVFPAGRQWTFLRGPHP
jgi:hypothetical protein